MKDLERWIEWPEWAADAVVTDVAIKFGWRDRLLILLGRPVSVTTKAFTECGVGKSEGRSRVTVHRIRWPWSRPSFAAAIAPRVSPRCPHGHAGCDGRHDLEDMPLGVRAR